MSYIQRALATYQVQIYEYELDIAGKTYYEEARISPINDDTALLMVRDITQRKQAEVDLQASEYKFRAIFATMFQFIGLLTPDGTLLEANQTALDFGGLTLEDVRNRPFWEARWWTGSEQTQGQLKAAIAQAAAGEFVRYEVDVLGAGDTVATIDFSLKPIKDETGKVILLIPEGRDISDRKQAEAELQASLKEKEILLKEVHHRVKNNLQIIYSLLRLQRRTLKDPQAVQSLLDSQGRIESIALVHEKLYRAGNLATVDFAEYIPGLVTNLLSSYNTQSKQIALDIAIAPITLDIDKAVPCGLIINELISNSLKYAFPTQDTGTIEVAMYTDEAAKIILLIKDDGVGLPPGFDIAQANSLGLQLVQDFVDQLKGTIQISCSQGTEFRIRFSASPI
jgi:PAS domain S-box-containing protein